MNLCVRVYTNVKLGEGKLWIQNLLKLRLKIDLVSYPARAEGLVNSTNVELYVWLSKIV